MRNVPAAGDDRPTGASRGQNAPSTPTRAPPSRDPAATPGDTSTQGAYRAAAGFGRLRDATIASVTPPAARMPPTTRLAPEASRRVS